MALTDDLISYWRLDEASGDAIDAYDSHDLTDQNGVGATTGLINGCRQFVGSSQEVLHSIDSEFSMGSTSQSYNFTFWVQITSTSGLQTAIAKRFNLLTGTGLDYLCRMDSGEPIVYWGDSSNFGSLSSGVTLSTNTWAFVQFGYDGSTNKFFVSVNDGTVQESAVVTDQTVTGNGRFALGGTFGIFGGEYLTGLLDEIGFWKRRLTASEITELYNGGAGLDFLGDDWINTCCIV